MAKNKLGIWTATSLVIGNMVGSGVFLLPSALASYGGISLVGWILSAAGALLVAKMFSNASKLLPDSDGGPYAYTRAGFGDFAGFLIAWGYWISIWCTNGAIVVAFISAMSTFFPALATNSLLAISTGLAVIWLLSWINTLGIKASGEVQLITTILKLVPLVGIGVMGFFYIRWENFVPFNVSGKSALEAITGSASLIFFAFMGLECATIPAGSIQDPEKTIPRATMLGTAITTLVYIAAMVSVMGLIPAMTLQHSVTPFADAASKLWGDQAHYWIAGGVAVASFGALNGWILVQGQIPYAVAQDRLFPASFARKNKKGVPVLGIVFSSVLVSVLMVMNFTRGLVEQFKFLILLATLSSLIPYLFVTAAYVMMEVRAGRLRPRQWRKTLIASGLAFLFSLMAVIGVGADTVYWGFVLLLTGTPFYVWNAWRRKERSDPEKAQEGE